MPSYTYILLLLVLFAILYWQHRNNKIIFAKNIVNKKNRKGRIEMLELAKRFLDKECIIYTFSSTEMVGTIKEVSDGALMIERSDSSMEAVNIDFVVRIRETPKKKNGKKKSIVLD